MSASAFVHESGILTLQEPAHDTHRVAELFDDGRHHLLKITSESRVDRDFAGKLRNVHLSECAVPPPKSTSDGRDRRTRQTQGSAIRSRSLKASRNIFESGEPLRNSRELERMVSSSPAISQFESNRCSSSSTKKVTDVEAADAIEFATACFPSKSKEEIAQMLHDCDYNMDHLAATLLIDTPSIEDLTSQEETNIPAHESSLQQEYAKDTDGLLENFDDFLDHRGKKYHCNIPTEIASSCTNSSDVGSTTSEKVFSTNQSMSSSATNSTAFSSSSDSGSDGKDDDWRVDLLAHMLPHTPRSKIQVVLEECGGDISHAACKLMPPGLEGDVEDVTTEHQNSHKNAAPSPNPVSNLQQLGYSAREFDASLVYLASVFPDLSIDGLRRHLELTNGNREQAVDMVLALNFSRQGIANATENEKTGGKKRRMRTVRGPAVRGQIITVAGTTSIPSSPTAGVTGSTQDNHPASTTDDPFECRKYASKLYGERNELLSKAAAAHRSGNGTGVGKGRALAAYYSEEGHRRGALARKWDERAAMATIRQELNSSSNSFTVDLHGLRVSEAIPLSQQLVEKWWNSVSSEGKSKRHAARSNPYTIICGKGIHSQGGIPRLFPAISKSLIENGWDVSLEIRGCVIVNGKRKRSDIG